jgi:hypothetical protein
MAPEAVSRVFGSNPPRLVFVSSLAAPFDLTLEGRTRGA